MIDEDPSEDEHRWTDQIQSEHAKFLQLMKNKVSELQLIVPTDASGYQTVAGLQPDCCSLLSQIAG